MAEPARVAEQRGCPRLTERGGRLVTCSHLEPCPFHGSTLTVITTNLDTASTETASDSPT